MSLSSGLLWPGSVCCPTEPLDWAWKFRIARESAVNSYRPRYRRIRTLGCMKILNNPEILGWPKKAWVVVRKLSWSLHESPWQFSVQNALKHYLHSYPSVSPHSLLRMYVPKLQELAYRRAKEMPPTRALQCRSASCGLLEKPAAHKTTQNW